MAKKKKTKKKTKKSTESTPIETIEHQDKRPLIPTEETQKFMKEEDREETKTLYPRDPSLDPQLVWKGKDEQDAEDLAVPTVPIYIQEVVKPQAIIEDIRSRDEVEDEAGEQLDLFADEAVEDFSQKLNFYEHETGWKNRMILGDSLLVLNSLAEKEHLKGQVQMIYLDPPYGIKFGSNWQVSTRKQVVKDGRVTDATRQPEQVKAFRDTWELGIHSYLAYLRDRLTVARELLTESGSIFVQIGNDNVHLVRCLLDEVFGSENFIHLLVVVKTAGLASGTIPSSTDFVIWYGKNSQNCKVKPVFRKKKEDSVYKKKDESGRIYRIDNLTATNNNVQSCLYNYAIQGNTYHPPHTSQWKTKKAGMDRLSRAQRLAIGKGLYYKRYLDDFPVKPVNNLWADTGTGGFVEEKWYVVQTNAKIIQRCMLMTTDPGDLVLDPTCGSGTTAFVAEQWGRRWITVDTSRVALTLARTRMMSGKFPYYLLADSPAGREQEAKITGQPQPDQPAGQDIRQGFVYERVPHIMLKHIANNEEIDTIHEKWQQKLVPLLAELNEATGQTWEEWEVPREPGEDWKKKAVGLLDDWWNLRRKRQTEIDESIARNADQEMLYDKPYEDKKTIRVAGPFSMESLSPHRRITVQEKIDKRTTVPGTDVRTVGPDDFGNMIIDNLRKSGVQNQVKEERLKWDRLDPFPGEWIHAQGEYTDKTGEVKTVAISVGPEHGTVGPELIREAAKEAMKGVGHDLLLICGFAFDPLADEESKQYGKLTVQTCRMNPDLVMGDKLLKKTGAGNLFMIFGEPDVEITPTDEDKLQVTIKGVDVYDPTTGALRSDSTNDIACWFIDTNYNEECFFVRHAYFTGADEPYTRLQKALKAEINEEAWQTLYATTSHPFPKPATGKIALKVINHYGDEVVKVYPVE